MRVRDSEACPRMGKTSPGSHRLSPSQPQSIDYETLQQPYLTAWGVSNTTRISNKHHDYKAPKKLAVCYCVVSMSQTKEENLRALKVQNRISL